MTPVRIRLRELRTAAGLTQQQLAEAVDVRPATISDLERRAPKRLDLELLDALAHALKCRPLDLIADNAGIRPRRGR